MRKQIYEKEETIWCFKIIFLVMVIFGFSYMEALGFSNQKTAFWGDTWQCKSCGYENYEGIHTCPICGNSK